MQALLGHVDSFWQTFRSHLRDRREPKPLAMGQCKSRSRGKLALMRTCSIRADERYLFLGTDVMPMHPRPLFLVLAYPHLPAGSFQQPDSESRSSRLFASIRLYSSRNPLSRLACGVAGTLLPSRCQFFRCSDIFTRSAHFASALDHLGLPFVWDDAPRT